MPLYIFIVNRNKRLFLVLKPTASSIIFKVHLGHPPSEHPSVRFLKGVNYFPTLYLYFLYIYIYILYIFLLLFSYYPTLLDSTSSWIIALYKIFQSLKYWRFRVYILPVSSSTTKKSGEGSEYCDNCTPLSFEEQTHLSETFLRFIETWINKIRRPAQKKSRVSLVGSCSRK